jgi:hypothetical protein
MAKVLKRERREDGYTYVFLSGLKCLTCASPLSDRWFRQHEPHDALCDSCAEMATRETYGNVAMDHREPRPLRFVAAESQPGQSSGKERKSMCYGEAENANGLWDNLIREMES